MSKAPFIIIEGGILNGSQINWAPELDSFSVETENKIFYYETVYEAHDPARIELIETETVE